MLYDVSICFVNGFVRVGCKTFLYLSVCTKLLVLCDWSNRLSSFSEKQEHWLNVFQIKYI